MAVLAVALLVACGPERPKQVIEVTQYNNGDGVPLYVSGDANKLSGAPRDFRTFLADQARKAIQADDGSCAEPPVYTIKTISDTGFAGGDFSQCGIKHLVWAKAEGEWSQVLSYDADPLCADLKAHKIPPGITGKTCRDDGGLRPYQG